MVTPESPAQNSPEWQRKAIEDHLAKHVLQGAIPPSDLDSIYQIEPLDDDPLRPAYELAAGDPVLFALYATQYELNERVMESHEDLSFHAHDLDARIQLETAMREFDEISELILQYTDPQNHPFYTVDLTDSRAQQQSTEGNPGEAETP